MGSVKGLVDLRATLEVIVGEEGSRSFGSDIIVDINSLCKFMFLEILVP